MIIITVTSTSIVIIQPDMNRATVRVIFYRVPVFQCLQSNQLLQATHKSMMLMVPIWAQTNEPPKSRAIL